MKLQLCNLRTRNYLARKVGHAPSVMCCSHSIFSRENLTNARKRSEGYLCGFSCGLKVDIDGWKNCGFFWFHTFNLVYFFYRRHCNLDIAITGQGQSFFPRDKEKCQWQFFSKIVTAILALSRALKRKLSQAGTKLSRPKFLKLSRAKLKCHGHFIINGTGTFKPEA